MSAMSIYTDENNELVISITEWCKNNPLDLSEYELKPDHRSFFGNQFMSEEDKKIQSEKMKQLILEGKHNFQKKNASECEHVRKLRSERMIGNTHGSKRKMTQELKNKLAEKSKGNTNVRNTKWWNDGKRRKRNKECPGEGWKEGFQIN